MTADEFRRLALALPDAVEGSHMGHPDFRARGRIFATLDAGGETGMATLSPEQQAARVAADPAAWSPASGAWGRQGCTLVRLADADAGEVERALMDAWERQAAKGPARRR